MWLEFRTGRSSGRPLLFSHSHIAWRNGGWRRAKAGRGQERSEAPTPAEQRAGREGILHIVSQIQLGVNVRTPPVFTRLYASEGLAPITALTHARELLRGSAAMRFCGGLTPTARHLPDRPVAWSSRAPKGRPRCAQMPQRRVRYCPAARAVAGGPPRRCKKSDGRLIVLQSHEVFPPRRRLPANPGAIPAVFSPPEQNSRRSHKRWFR